MIPLTCVSPKGAAQNADVTLLPGVYFRPHYAAYHKPKKTTTALSKQRPYQVVPDIAREQSAIQAGRQTIQSTTLIHRSFCTDLRQHYSRSESKVRNRAACVVLSDDKQKHPFSHQRDVSATCCSFARLALRHKRLSINAL